MGFEAKIARAKEHLDALKASVDAFVGEGKAYAVIKEVNREAGEYVFRLNILNDPPLVYWSLIVGDCLHNTRTALDHLIWGLAAKNHPKKIPGQTTKLVFPIFKNAATFNGRKVDLENWVGQRAFAMLEQLQPFNDARGWDKNPLMFLHEFDIYDKHKLLLPAVSILDSGKINPVPVAGKKALFDGHAVLLEFKDGAEIARFKVRAPEEMMDMNYSTTINVIFEGQPGPLFVIPTLKRVIEVVEGVGADFTPLF